MTVTATPPPAPPDSSTLTDQLQGRGTLAAAIVAAWDLFITIKTARRDREDGANQREQDRKDADRRLAEEREAASANLERQLEEQRERDRREFLIEQLQRVGDAYGDIEAHPNTPQASAARERLRATLPVLPPRYASLLKMKYLPPQRQSEEAYTEARRRAEVPGVPIADVKAPHIYKELADNIEELLTGKGQLMDDLPLAPTASARSLRSQQAPPPACAW
ncbi:hypothetical protein [Microbispora sp. GKU 823]|uniref:hypothetical protein n=1 Tax=Microbispora sp. GKU 823 TaxID=1652100 RepID=UPI0009A26C71|nr:hypothetical protein [Microbispora sp. GKU 823]OPG12528.1 hypothetical protein B1L11_14190 [Microbispora sp. GKU 823]